MLSSISSIKSIIRMMEFALIMASLFQNSSDPTDGGSEARVYSRELDSQSANVIIAYRLIRRSHKYGLD